MVRVMSGVQHKDRKRVTYFMLTLAIANSVCSFVWSRVEERGWPCLDIFISLGNVLFWSPFIMDDVFLFI